MISESLMCIAMTMWGEARGEGEQGMIATGYSVVNRYHDPNYPKSYCKIMKQSYQYDFLNKRLPTKKEVNSILPLAEKVMKREVPDPTHGATHFHNKSCKPIWTNSMQLTAVINNHLFYKKRETQKWTTYKLTLNK